MNKPTIITIATVCFNLAAGMGLGQQPQNAPGDPPRFHIRGIVVDDASGTPLSSANVMLALPGQMDGFRKELTGEDGRFDFGNLANGKYKLTAERRGFLTQSYDQHGQLFSLVVVGGDIPPADVVVRLHAESSISGQVRDEQGEAVRYADVLLFRKRASAGIAAPQLDIRTKTDDRGLYAFSHLQPGEYYIAVSAQPWYARYRGFLNSGTFGSPPPEKTKSSSDAADDNVNPRLDVAYPVTFYANVTEPDAATAIVLPRDANLKADVSLHALPSLSLRIQTPERGQAANVTLQQPIFDYNVTLPIRSRRETTGLFDIAGITPGRYFMTVDSLERQHIASETRSVDLSQSGNVSKVDGQSLASLTVIFDRALPKGQGVLSFRNERTGAIVEEPVSDRRTFQFHQKFAAGDYSVSLRHASDFFVQNIAASGARIVKRILKIEGSSPVNLALAVQRGSVRLEGVALRSDSPAAGVMVALVPMNLENNAGDTRREQSNSDGSFAFTAVTPGTYILLAFENPWNQEWTTERFLEPYLAQGQQVRVSLEDAPGRVMSVRVSVH